MPVALCCLDPDGHLVENFDGGCDKVPSKMSTPVCRKMRAGTCFFGSVQKLIWHMMSQTRQGGQKCETRWRLREACHTHTVVSSGVGELSWRGCGCLGGCRLMLVWGCSSCRLLQPQ